MKILVITSRFPYPMEKGDKHRAFHQIQELSVHHDVTLVALNHGPVDPADLAKVRRECCPRVHVVELGRVATLLSTLKALLTGVPLQVGYFRTADAAAQVDRIIAEERPDHVYCQLIRTAPYNRGLDGRGRDIPSTIDYQDAFSTSTLRRAERAKWPTNWWLRIEARRIASYEARVFDWFDRHVIISAQDRDSMTFPGAASIELVTSAVDTEDFHPMPPPEDQHDMAFVGNMGYAPNVRAASMLAEEILPLVRARRPGANVLLAGARPSRTVRNLASDDVEVSGWVDDIRDAYRSGRVMVAPLIIGAGQQNKILEAMAMGVPCVTTELVNRAIGAEPGVEIFVASTPQEFADQIVMLLEDPAVRERVAVAARDFVQRNYSWSSIGDRLDAVMSEGRRVR